LEGALKDLKQANQIAPNDKVTLDIIQSVSMKWKGKTKHSALKSPKSLLPFPRFPSNPIYQEQKRGFLSFYCNFI